MNSNVTSHVVNMGNDELRQLVNQVNETVATDVDASNATSKNTFAAASLWNIHKMKSNSSARRSTMWN